MSRHLVSLAILVFMTASCAPARDATDKKLEKACLAAVTALANEGTEIFPQNTAYRYEKSDDGLDLRTVMIEARTSVNKGAYRVSSYLCSFEEKSGPFGLGYSAKFHHMEESGMKYGNYKGEIHGDFNDLMKITNAMDGVLL